MFTTCHREKKKLSIISSGKKSTTRDTEERKAVAEQRHAKLFNPPLAILYLPVLLGRTVSSA
jgi:hypothetical protein